jgi:hypothetical protein
MVVAQEDYSTALFDTMGNTATTQDLLLAYTPKACATLSIPSSLFIIWEAIEDHRKGKGTAIQRALVGMSVVDVCASTAWFLSTWAVPIGSGPLAKGNIASCNFQGFLLQLAVGAPLYNCSLALYYLLVIRFNWTNDQLVKIERYVHSFILAFMVGTSIAGLPMTMYNRVGSVCWVVGSPPECGSSSAWPPNTDVPCDRGDYAWLFGIFLFYGPLWICVLLTVTAMLMIYIQVRRTFGKTRSYLYADSANHHHHHHPRVSSNNTNTTARDGGGGGGGVAVGRDSNAISIGLGGSGRDNNDSSTGFQEQSTLRMASTPDIAAPLPRADSRFSRLSIFNPRSSTFSGHMTNPTGGMTLEELAELSENNDEGDDEDGDMVEVPDTRGNRETWLSQATSTVTTTASRLLETRQRSNQNLFATQAILYSGSFFITWSPSTVWSVAHWFNAGSFALDYAAAFCEPLQGFWNMLIFIRRRPSSRKKIYNFFCGILCFWNSCWNGKHSRGNTSTSIEGAAGGSVSCETNREMSQTDPGGHKRRGRNPGPLRSLQSGHVSSVHFEDDEEDDSNDDDDTVDDKK